MILLYVKINQGNYTAPRLFSGIIKILHMRKKNEIPTRKQAVKIWY